MALTKAQKTANKQRAAEWRAFRAKHLFSQRDLALSLGLSRRTVQNIECEDSEYIPYPATLSKFATLKERFEGPSDAKQKPTGVRRRGH